MIDKSTIFFSKIAEVVKDIPGLKKFSSPFEAAAEAGEGAPAEDVLVEMTEDNLEDNQQKAT